MKSFLVRKPESRAFTLIELLVVIAIIGLLVSLLLPALGKAKKAALMARSLSNLRQITTSARTYQEDYKGKMPLVLSYQRGGSPGAGAGALEGWCTWSFGGKNCAGAWSAQAFDVEAADRPLNPYITTDIIDAQAGLVMPANDPNREIFQLQVFQDPSDKIGHQRNWPGENPDGSNCYQDVGTSYQFNVKWWQQIYGRPPIGGNFIRAFAAGTARMAIADTFQPSRFVWLHDEYADLVVNNTNVNYRLKNGYDDINRSLLGFMDGHASYHVVYPGSAQNSFEQPNYTFIFNDLRLQ